MENTIPQKTQNTLIIFLSAIAGFCFFSDCRNSFSCKLKKLINEQIIIFHTLSNEFCSPIEFVRNRFIGVFPSHLVQSANTELLLAKTQRVLNISNKCPNMRYRKNQVFIVYHKFTKLKKIITLFLRHSPRKTCYKIEQGFMVGSLSWRS